jgi:hypothetical protein
MVVHLHVICDTKGMDWNVMDEQPSIPLSEKVSVLCGGIFSDYRKVEHITPKEEESIFGVF